MNERIIPEVKNNKKTQIIKGFFVTNKTYHPIRIQTLDGCEYCKGNSSVWIWSEEIVKFWEAER